MILCPTAQAQDAGELAQRLGSDVRCQETRSIGDLSANVAEQGGDDPVLLAEALALLGADEDVCDPIRAAARSLAADLAVTTVNPDAQVRDAARAAVDATLAEAERRAASLKFEVGPPPLNLARGRSGGS